MTGILSRLFRPRLALLNGISTMGGYLLFPAPIEQGSLWATCFGVILLAAAGSALNQVLERDIDRLMERTRCRPIPSGTLTPAAAAVIGGFCLLSGLLLLSYGGGIFPALLGAATLVWYLGVYTPLKRRTSFALAIGAICGTLPPVIGWCSAGGNPVDFRVVLLAGLFYLWQIPHFWLFQRRHADDYRRAGIPFFEPGARGASPAGICRLWLVALMAGAMLLPAFGIIVRHVALWYAAFPVILIILYRKRSETVLFTCLNFFPILITLALFAQKW
jgi:protoheme IX farnesyltransferase